MAIVERVSSWIQVVRNPSSWRYRYSLEVKDGNSWGIYSQHMKIKTARIAGQKVGVKYNSGHQALTTKKK